jgi:hypothetical protein
MKTENQAVIEETNINSAESASADRESALRTLQECELMMIGGGGADVVFG